MAFYQMDLVECFNMVHALDLDHDTANKYIKRLNKLSSIPNKAANVVRFTDSILNPSTPIEDVVEIFSRLNTHGKKLTDVDIALARMGVEWPSVRDELTAKVDGWRTSLSISRSLDKSPLDLKWLLRTTVAVNYGTTDFNALWTNNSNDVRKSFEVTHKCVDNALNLIGDRLGLTHSPVILSPYSLPVICRWLRGLGRGSNSTEEGIILAWYIRSAIRERFTSATDDHIRKCVSLVDEGHVAKLDEELDQWIQQQGYHLEVHADDFAGSGTRRSGRSQIFLSILYMMTRVDSARDLLKGHALSTNLLGPRSKLEVHHIFPQKYLEDNKIRDITLVDAHANLCYLTAESNREISDTPPSQYLAKAEQEYGGVLESQWIPQNADLWNVEKYDQFLKERQSLMAQSVNAFLTRMKDGHLSDNLRSSPASPIPDNDLLDNRLTAVIDLCEELGLSPPITNHELADNDTFYALDLAWPDGLQEGLTQPVAYLLKADEEAARWQGIVGWRFFFTYETFEEYAQDL